MNRRRRFLAKRRQRVQKLKAYYDNIRWNTPNGFASAIVAAARWKWIQALRELEAGRRL